MDKSLDLSGEETGSHSFITTEDLKKIDKCSDFYIKLAKSRPDSRKARKIRNFHKLYLNFGLWPEKDPKETFESLAKLQTKLRKLSLKNELLEAEKENSSKSCKDHEEKHTKSKQALTHALELSSVLLKQIAEFGRAN